MSVVETIRGLRKKSLADDDDSLQDAPAPREVNKPKLHYYTPGSTPPFDRYSAASLSSCTLSSSTASPSPSSHPQASRPTCPSISI